MGRTFQEAFQKALRGLETGHRRLTNARPRGEIIEKEIGEPAPSASWYVADAFRIGMSLEIHDETPHRPVVPGADRGDRRHRGGARDGRCAGQLSADELRFLKQKGFSDKRLAKLLGRTSTRCAWRARSACARSTSASTPARPSSPRRPPTCTRPTRTTASARPADRPTAKIMVLGGGPTASARASSSTTAACTRRSPCARTGYETIMVNCNPETVSTDYDTSDRLYFEPLTLEDVLEIVDKEKPVGVIVQYGGQTPLKLALDLEARRRAHHRHLARQHRHRRRPRALPEAAARAGPAQPPNRTARTREISLALADEIGYPLVVRPSYVLGGRAMEIVHGDKDLARYMREAVQGERRSRRCCSTASSTTRSRSTSTASPTASPDGVMIGGIMGAHRAGRHPFRRLGLFAAAPTRCPPRCRTSCAARPPLMARALNVVGLMNVQFAIQGDTSGDGRRPPSTCWK